MLPTLYHISFNDRLEGKWKPNDPKWLKLKSFNNPSAPYPEPNVSRISFSPTIEQCFQAVYQNVKHLFGGRYKYPWMDYHVYSPVMTGQEKIWTPEYMRKNRLVHDAHVTEEHCVLSSVELKLVMLVRIHKPTEDSKIEYYPFDDRSEDINFVQPKYVKYDVIEDFRSISLEKIPLYAKW